MTSGERQRVWRAHDSMASSPAPVGIASTTPMSPEVVHPSAEQLEAAAFGWLDAAEAETVLAHARACPVCGPGLASDQEVRRRLGTLRRLSPRFNAAHAVLRHLDPHRQRARPLWPPAARPALRAVRLTRVVVTAASVGVRRDR